MNHLTFPYYNRCGLIIQALASRGVGSSLDQGHCVVFLGKTLYSHGASLHSGLLMGTGERKSLKGIPTETSYNLHG